MRDYTDWYVVVRHADEPSHAYWHFYNDEAAKKRKEFTYKGQGYAFNIARATTLRGWRPWRLVSGKFRFRKLGTYLNELFRSKRIGLLVYNEPETKFPGLVQPIHVSKIEPTDPETNPVTARMTTRVLASIVENNLYRLTWRSIKFGVVGVIKTRWVLIVVAAIIGVVLLLYFTGNLPVGGA